MTGRTLTLSALVALTQAKAIVTNHCPHDVYIWSIPQVGSSHTDNVPIKPGGRYEEPWRRGTATNPGIAIKVSPQADGIHIGKDEINFAYSIEHSDNSKIWVDLSPVRGKAFDNNLAFHTCHGPYQTPDVPTRQCDATDDIELILCDTARTTPAKDVIPFDKIQECYDYHHVYHEPTYDYPDHVSDDDHPEYKPHTWEKPYHSLPKPTTNKPNYSPPKHTSEKYYPPPPKYTSEEHYPPPKHTLEHHYPPPKHTDYSPPKHTPEKHYSPPKHTSDKYNAPPEPTTHKPHHPPPKHTPDDYKPPHKHTSEQYPPPKHTSKKYNAPPKPTIDKPRYPPPKHTSEKYKNPPKHTPAEHYPAPKHTSGQYLPPKHTVHYSPPQHTDEHYAPPKHTKEHYAPPKHTEEPYSPPKHTAEHYPPPKHTEEHYAPPKHTKESYAPPKHTGGYYPPAKPTSRPYFAPTHTKEHYEPPRHAVGQYSPPKHTAESYPPPKHTNQRYPPPKQTPNKHYSPPRPTWDEDEHYPPPSPTWDDYAPPQPTSEEYYPPPKSTFKDPYYPPPKHSSGAPHYNPPQHTAGQPYYSPPKHTKNGPHYPPPKHTRHDSHYATTKPTRFVPRPPHYSQPHHTDRKSYSPPHYSPQNQPYRTPAPWPKPSREPYPPPHKSDVAKSYPAPAKPTYHVRNIEAESSTKLSCSTSECDKTPVTNRCLARVVYPWRRSALSRDRNNTSIQTKPRTTVPLSAVLQLEAAKHEPATQSVKKATPASPLCDIVRKYHPGISDCDEEASKVYAKEIYPRLCEPEYEEILHKIDCNQVKGELIKAYPDANKPSIAHAGTNSTILESLSKKRCILPWCEPAQPGVNCKEAEASLDERDKKKSIDWTTSDDVCHTFLMARNVAVPLGSQKRGKPKACITPACTVNHLSKKACGKLEDLFEQLSKDQGYPEDFTTDDDVCGTSLAARNATLPSVIKSILSQTSATMSKRAGQKLCVLPYCKGLTEEACEDVEQLMEQLAKDVGGDIDYTTDDDVCNTAKTLNAAKSANPAKSNH